MRHLLPCECGESVTVDGSQAGTTVSCVCGATLDVPTLRGIRQLEPVGEAEASPAKSQTPGRGTSGWSAARGAVFSVGVAVLLLSASAAAWAAVARTPYLEMQVPPSLDDLPADQSLQLWQDFHDNGLAGSGQWPYVEARRMVSELTRLMYVAAAFTAVSLAAVVASILHRRDTR